MFILWPSFMKHCRRREREMIACTIVVQCLSTGTMLKDVMSFEVGAVRNLFVVAGITTVHNEIQGYRVQDVGAFYTP